MSEHEESDQKKAFSHIFKYNYLIMAFSAASFILAIVVFIVFFINSSFQEEIISIHHQIDSIAYRISNLERLDLRLTSAARLAAETNNPEWEKIYLEHLPIANEEIAAIEVLIPEHASRFLLYTDRANQQLQSMEKQAFELIHAGNREQARKILYGDKYLLQKKIYMQGLSNGIKVLNKDLNGQELRLQHFSTICIYIAIVCSVIYVILSVAIGYLLLKLSYSCKTTRKVMRRQKAYFSSLACRDLKGLSDAIVHEIQEIKEGKNTSTELLEDRGQELTHLVDSMIHIDDFKERKIFLHETKQNFSEILQEYAKEWELEAKEKNITLSLTGNEKLPNFLIDKEKLKLAFLNLIRALTTILLEGTKLHVQLLLEGEDSVCIQFRSDIWKIDALFHDRLLVLFNESVQFEHPENSFDVDLISAKAIIEAHGGSIHVESVENHYLQLSVFLPINEEA